MPVSDPPSAAYALVSSAAEAARYALLRRLAPSMRHHLVVNLQPIGMIYEVMDRRLRAPEPDVANVQRERQQDQRLRPRRPSFVRWTWWAGWRRTRPSPPRCRSAPRMLRLAVHQHELPGLCAAQPVEAVAGEVRRCAMRSLLTGTLIHLADQLKPPAELVLTAQAEADAVLLRARCRRRTATRVSANEPATASSNGPTCRRWPRRKAHAGPRRRVRHHRIPTV
jgi:hypothetical protein